jgi:hypothetical protein
VTESDQEVVVEVEAFFARHGAGPASVDPTGLRFLFDEPDIEEIDAALAELAAHRNGTDPTE